MVSFNKFFTSVFLAVVYASSTAFAAPWEPSAKYATHRVREVSSDLKLETYHPESTYEVCINPITLFPPPSS